MKNKNIIFISILVAIICITGCNRRDIGIPSQKELNEYILDNLDSSNAFQDELDESMVDIIDVSKDSFQEVNEITENDIDIINDSQVVTELTPISYDISSMTYTIEDDDNSISIKYPLISGLNDQIKQKIINELIMTEALKVYNYYDCEDRGHLALDIEFNISLKSDYILSIQYYGLGYVEEAARPNKLFYTTNIDILTGIKLRLVDLVNIEDEFINMYINGEFEYVGPLEEEPNLGYYGTHAFAEKGFINADNMESVFSYLTVDSLGISIPVAHAIGGYAEFEIKYKDIPEYLVGNSQGWNKFITSAKK
ncbi:UNVERIFIED_CONTAM: hypothetical protein Cloal_1699 [Acetivibrio alkalicellulosi]